MERISLHQVLSYAIGARGRIHSLEKGVTIWAEAFGNRKDPPLLLIMGAGCQGILWPKSFCQRLVSLGAYVIRFDLRDTGLSSYFDYQITPYTLLDMAQDAKDLLHALAIEKAHVLGTSMGGAIAQLLAAHFPECVSSLSLLATTFDWRNLVHALRGEPLEREEGVLSIPSECFLSWIRSLSLQKPTLSCWQKLKKQFEGWEILNGPDVPFDRRYYMKLFLQSIARQRSYQPMLNHAYALGASLGLLLETEGKIRAPALIIQGEKDPIFPRDHGERLCHSIPQSRLIVLERMGHNLNPCFYDPILEALKKSFF